MEEQKKLKKFYIFPVLYVLSVYMVLTNIFIEEEGLFSTLIFLSPFITGILNIILCICCCKPQYHDIMITSAAITKYCMVPFFTIGGIFTAGSFISSLMPIPFMFIVGTSIGFILCITGWLIVAFGSPYTISYIVLSQREGRTSKGMAALHIISQFFFIMDVIDVICLSFRAKRNIKMSVAVIIFICVSFISIIALFLFLLLQVITG